MYIYKMSSLVSFFKQLRIGNTNDINEWINKFRDNFCINDDSGDNGVDTDDADADPYLTDKENDRKRKRCESDDDKINEIYEEDIDSDFYDDEDMEEMMSYYKSIITDEVNDDETNTPEERETFSKMYSEFDTIKRYLQPPAKRIKLSFDPNMNSTVSFGYESDLEMM